MTIRAFLAAVASVALALSDNSAPDLYTKQRVCIELDLNAIACVMAILSPWNATLESDTAVSATLAAWGRYTRPVARSALVLTERPYLNR